MARVSKWDLGDRRIREMIQQLWDGITLLEDRKEVIKFFSKFFTPTEIEMFAKRLALLKLADSDLPVNQILRFLGIAKVTAYEWFEKHDSYEKDFHIVIDRLKEIDRKHLLKEKDINIKLGVSVAYQGYKKRIKRQSVLKDFK